VLSIYAYAIRLTLEMKSKARAGGNMTIELRRAIAMGQSILAASVVVLFCAGWGRADQAQAYPTMAPLNQYLMERNAEIALARTAAPEAISRDATIMVLGRNGYETAAEGKNGFICAVERGWMSPMNSPEFWNPKIRGPICFNPPAARSVWPLTIKRTQFVLAGLSKEQITEKLKAALAAKELPALEGGAMSYMMGKGSYLTDRGDHNLCHLMIYAPLMQGTAWGADVPGSPIMFAGQFQGAPEPITVFLVAVAKWSDGTPAPEM
jgi:hypothetical protein